MMIQSRFKTCFKCKVKKSLDEFYKHSEMKDGYLNKCKKCAKLDMKNYRLANVDEIRAYDRQRAKTRKRKLLSQKQTKKYRNQFPERYFANTKLNNALKAGKIKKPTRCEKCKRKTKLSAHHFDYSKLLEVIWVCQICHSSLHSKE